MANISYMVSNVGGGASPSSSEPIESSINFISKKSIDFDLESQTSAEQPMARKREKKLSIMIFKPNNRSLRETEENDEEIKDTVSPLLKPGGSKFGEVLRKGKRETSLVENKDIEQMLSKLQSLLLQGQQSHGPKIQKSFDNAGDPSNPRDSENNADSANDLPMIFGGLNTEKMFEFSLYYPYNNCSYVVDYIKNLKEKNRRRRKKGKKTQRASMAASGWIHFRDQQNFFMKNRQPKKKSSAKPRINFFGRLLDKIGSKNLE
jgi:hypothetical protein